MDYSMLTRPLVAIVGIPGLGTTFKMGGPKTVSGRAWEGGKLT